MGEEYEEMVSPGASLSAAERTATKSSAATGLVERLGALADELDRAATDRQAWADHPDIGGVKPQFASHLRGKRYGYSHAAQLIRSALTQAQATGEQP